MSCFFYVASELSFLLLAFWLAQCWMMTSATTILVCKSSWGLSHLHVVQSLHQSYHKTTFFFIIACFTVNRLSNKCTKKFKCLFSKHFALILSCMTLLNPSQTLLYTWLHYALLYFPFPSTLVKCCRNLFIKIGP